MNGNVGRRAWGCERKEKKKEKKKRFTYTDGRDGVCADPLCVVKDAVYSWLLTRMDGGGVGCRAWECEKKKSVTYADGWRSTRVGGDRLGAR